MAALEVHEQRDDRQQLEADAEHPELGLAADASTIQLKFCPKKPVMKVSGRKIVAISASCLVTSFSRLETVERYASLAPVSRSR